MSKSFERPKNNILTFGYTSWRHPIHNLRQLFRNLRYGWQRAVKGYCDVDVWDIDSWLVDTLPNMLLDLKETHCAYPGENRTDGCSCSNEEWEEILGQMAYDFWAAGEDRLPNKFDEAVDAIFAQKPHPWEDHWTPAERDVMVQRRKEYLRLAEERKKHKNAACDALKKWFFHLWD